MSHVSFLKLDPLLVAICEWCGKSCSDMDACCSTACEAQVARMEAVRGRIILRHVMRWRMHRGRKGTDGEGELMRISRIIDGFLKEDRHRRERAGEKRRLTDAPNVGSQYEKPDGTNYVKTERGWEQMGPARNPERK